MTTLSIRVLGPLEIVRVNAPGLTAPDPPVSGESTSAPFAYNKVRALLVYLAVEAGPPHKRAHLCALLWPDQDDRASRRNLSQALTQLRRVTGGTGPLEAATGLLRTTSDDVQLDAAASVAVDATQFIQLLTACERHAHQSWHTCSACAERLQAALALYRGDFLAGFSLPDSAPFEEWALLWRERLRQRALSALERLAAGAEWRGAFGAAAAYAQRQVELDALNEAAHREAMRLLALNGELAAAGAQFDQLRRLLDAELGMAPESVTVQLHERLRAGAADSLRRFRPPPFELPSPPNPLIGRDEALGAVVNRLRDPDVRALTLTGAPGIGKTRLALAAATALRFDFQDGVHLVELAPVPEASLVPAALAQALGMKEQAGQTLAASLRNHLHTRHTLLVLDNCEHVLEAASFVAELVAGCPALKVLATSRARLRIRAEHALPVDPLSEASAQQLFVDRVAAVGSDPPAALAPGPTLAALCRRLDYLPLAIELIAVRAHTLAADELLRQLDQPLRALTAGPRDLPERQRTLRSALAWSYDRLPAAEQRVFRHLGVFAGGGAAEAVQAVAGAAAPVLGELEALHAASLAQVHAAGESTRFSLLETLREFALEQLAQHGEAEAARRRHAAFFLALAERAKPEIPGLRQAVWLDRLERDHDNLRAVLLHAPEAELKRRLAVALGRFWELRGYLTEGRRWLAEALAGAPPADQRWQGEALALAAILAYRQGDYESARALNEQSLAVWRQLEDETAIAQALRRLGIVFHDLGDLALAQSHHQQSLEHARSAGDVQGVAASLNNLGLIASDQGDDVTARALYEESLPLFQQIGDHGNAGMTLLNLGLLASHAHDYPAARALIEQSLAIFRGLGHKWGLALALFNLGHVALKQPDLDLAADCYQQSLTLNQELGDPATATYSVFGLGGVAFAQGDYPRARALYRESLAQRHALGEQLPVPRNLEGLGELERLAGFPERAAQLYGAAEALRETQGTKLNADYLREYTREVAALRAALGNAAFDRAWAAGRALTLEQAVALGLE